MAKKLKTKTEEIRKLSDKDLDKEMEGAYRRLVSLRVQKVTQRLTNHRELPKLQRQIARLKTIQRERALVRLLAEEGR